MRCIPICVTEALLVIISGITYALVYYHRVWPSILYDELALAYNVTETRIGVLSTMYFWPYALMQPIAGTLADIMEPGYLMGGATALAASGALLIGFTSDFTLACFSRVLIGLGCAPIIVPICRVLANWFSPRGFYFLQGLVHVFGAIGGILAQGPLASIIDSIEWRYTFFFVSGLGFFMSLLTFIFIRGDPKSAGYNLGVVMGLDASSSGAGERFDTPLIEDDTRLRELSCCQKFKQKLSVLGKNIKKALTNRQFCTLTMTNSFIPGSFYSFTGMWGGPYLQDLFGYSDNEAGYILVLLNIAYVVGTPLLSFLSEVVKSRKKVLCVTSVCALAISLGFVFLQKGQPKALVLFMIFALGFFTSGSTSTIITMFKELDSVEVSGTMIGCSNIFPFLATTLLQYLGTLILEKVDGDEFKQYQLAVWVPTVVCCFLGTVGIFVSRDTYPDPGNENMMPTPLVPDE